jgi:hypothetical protein
MVNSSRPSLRSAGSKPVHTLASTPPATRHATSSSSHAVSTITALRTSTRANKADFGAQRFPPEVLHVQKSSIGRVAHPTSDGLPTRTSRSLPDRRPPKRKFSASEDADSKISNGLKAGLSIRELPDRTIPRNRVLDRNVSPRKRRTASEDTRSLRSKAGGSRLKSDLATYFTNFDDIISGAPREPGTQKTSFR